jgi:hypothetical protein
LGAVKKSLQQAHTVLITVTRNMHCLPALGIEENRRLALVLNRCVGDEVEYQIENLGWIMEEGSPKVLRRKIGKGGVS